MARRASAPGGRSSWPTRAATRRPSAVLAHAGRAARHRAGHRAATPELIAAQPDGELFGVLLQYPATDGAHRRLRGRSSSARTQRGALVAMAADLLALTLLTPPGELGADIAVGTAQRFGVPLGYGGPHAAFFASATSSSASCPGRIVGVSRGRRTASRALPAWRCRPASSTSAARRRRATSARRRSLLAVMAGHVRRLPRARGAHARSPERVHGHASRPRAGAERARRASSVPPALLRHGARRRLPGRAAQAVEAAARAARLQPVRPRRRPSSSASRSTRRRRRPTSTRCWRSSRGSAPRRPRRARPRRPAPLPGGLGAGRSAYLTHPVFNAHHSETEMLRYMRAARADRDLSLDHSMIPLGSCTMKLNATAEMMPVTWPEFAGLHPFAPLEQAPGYQQLIGEPRGDARRDHRLRRRVAAAQRRVARASSPGCWSSASTTAAAASRQRDVCLIPRVGARHQRRPAPRWPACASSSSPATTTATSTSPTCGPRRTRTRAPRRAHGHLPVDHGVFEETIGRHLRDRPRARRPGVHRRRQPERAGRPLPRRPTIGADVCHLNLHKTFCIPHGGGGPGIGPIGGAAHLAPFLPGHPVLDGPRWQRRVGEPRATGGPVSAAPWGSAGILPISWAYIATDGRRRAAARDPGRHPERELRRPAARPALPGALHRARRARRPRVHPRPAADHRADRRDRRGRRQAADRLRLPRADDVASRWPAR